jgi:hypothetical protein
MAPGGRFNRFENFLHCVRHCSAVMSDHLPTVAGQGFSSGWYNSRPEPSPKALSRRPSAKRLTWATNHSIELWLESNTGEGAFPC